MTEVQLMFAIRDALAADAALRAWCQTNFSKTPTIYLGIDDRKPPPADEYPIVVVTGITFAQGEGAREIVAGVELGVGVLQEEIVSSGDLRTFTGFIQAEELRGLAEDAVYRLRLPGSVDNRANSASLSAYPIFVSYSVITIRDLKTTRRGLPA